MWGEGSRAEISVEGVCAACSAKLERTAPSAGRGLLGTLQLSGVDGRIGGGWGGGVRCFPPSPHQEFRRSISTIGGGAGGNSQESAVDWRRSTFMMAADLRQRPRFTAPSIKASAQLYVTRYGNERAPFVGLVVFSLGSAVHDVTFSPQ